jgi:hypothetical protein
MKATRTLHQRLGTGLLMALAFAACSAQPGAAPPPPPGPEASVTVHLTGPADLAVGGTAQFEAVVEQAADPTVTWSVRGPGGESEGVGVIDSSGLYTAPALVPTDPDVIVSATSLEDPGAIAEAVIRIVPIVTVSGDSAVASGASLTLSAALSGYADPESHAVSWSVAPGSEGGPTGSIDSATGEFTAPEVGDEEIVTVIVTATSSDEPLASGSHELEVRGANHQVSSVSVTRIKGPGSVASGSGTTILVQATVTATAGTSTAVIWSLSPDLSTLVDNEDGTAVYSPPDSVAVNTHVFIRATSVIDPTVFGETSVLVRF